MSGVLTLQDSFLFLKTTGEENSAEAEISYQVWNAIQILLITYFGELLRMFYYPGVRV